MRSSNCLKRNRQRTISDADSDFNRLGSGRALRCKAGSAQSIALRVFRFDLMVDHSLIAKYLRESFDVISRPAEVHLTILSKTR